jgi:hypothetical protein
LHADGTEGGGSPNSNSLAIATAMEVDKKATTKPLCSVAFQNSSDVRDIEGGKRHHGILLSQSHGNIAALITQQSATKDK